MPRAESLRQLDRLFDLVAGLGDKERGMPVRSEDWNTLVAAVLSLGRLAVERDKGASARGSAYASARHGHVAAVELEWLSPALQERLGVGGKTHDVLDLARLRKAIDRLSARVRRLEERLDGLEQRKDTDEDVREDMRRRVDSLDERFVAVDRVDLEIAKVKASVARTDKELVATAALKDRLVDADGRLPDLVALEKKVSEVESLRARLTDSAGELLDLRALRATVADLSEKVEALPRGSTADGVDASALEEAVAKAAATRALAAVEEAMAAEATRRDEAGVALAESFAEHRGTVEEELGALRAATTHHESALGRADVRLAAAEAAVAGQRNRLAALDGVDVALTGLRTAVKGTDARVRAQAEALGALEGMGDRVKALERTVTDSALVDRVTKMERSLTSTSKSVSALAERIEGVELSFDTQVLDALRNSDLVVRRDG